MNAKICVQECKFKAVRSSGAGGQHVNKVSSKIELSFYLWESIGLSDNEKQRIIKKLSNKFTKDGVLLLQCSTSRSQHKNKEIVIERFVETLKLGLIVPKSRIQTKVPKSVIRKRLQNKNYRSKLKQNRKKPDLD